MNFFPVYPIVCGLAIIAVLLPLPWHLKARNTGTLLYIGWTLVGNIMFMVNTIVWHRNVIDHAPVWCDITVKLILGLSAGITASSLCINRRLYNIATIKSVSISAKHKRREAIIDLLLGIGLPCMVMALSYVVQGQRYNLVEDVGCWPNVYNSLLSYVLVWMWPIIISCASFIYCALSIRAFLKTRQQFNQILSNSHSGVNMSRYFRLMALASTEMLFSLPLAVFFFINNLRNGVNPWVSWDDLKYRFSDIQLWPSILVEAAGNGTIGFYLTLWATPAGGFIFFIYFGLGGETFADYKRIFWRLVAPLGLKPRPAKAQPTYQGRTLTSSVGTTESRVHTHLPSLPDLDETLEKSSMDDDLEAGKPKATQ